MTNLCVVELTAALHGALSDIEGLVDETTADRLQWTELLAAHFAGSMRTAQKYMRLARHVRQIQAQGPVAALSSQSEAAKTLTAILGGDRRATQKDRSHGTRRARGASLKKAGEMMGHVISLLRRIERDLLEAGPPNLVTRRSAEEVGKRRTEVERLYEDLLGGAASGGNEPAPDVLTPPEALDGGFDELA